jgi:hypothetical protein
LTPALAPWQHETAKIDYRASKKFQLIHAAFGWKFGTSQNWCATFRTLIFLRRKSYLEMVKRIVMKFCMDKIVRELVEESWDEARLGRSRQFGDKYRVFSETLVELESEGKAMRYLDSKSRIAWRSTPEYRDYLSDRRIDAEEELDQS